LHKAISSISHHPTSESQCTHLGLSLVPIKTVNLAVLLFEGLKLPYRNLKPKTERQKLKSVLGFRMSATGFKSKVDNKNPRIQGWQ